MADCTMKERRITATATVLAVFLVVVRCSGESWRSDSSISLAIQAESSIHKSIPIRNTNRRNRKLRAGRIQLITGTVDGSYILENIVYPPSNPEEKQHNLPTRDVANTKRRTNDKRRNLKTGESNSKKSSKREADHDDKNIANAIKKQKDAKSTDTSSDIIQNGEDASISSSTTDVDTNESEGDLFTENVENIEEKRDNEPINAAETSSSNNANDNKNDGGVRLSVLMPIVLASSFFGFFVWKYFGGGQRFGTVKPSVPTTTNNSNTDDSVIVITNAELVEDVNEQRSP